MKMITSNKKWDELLPEAVVHQLLKSIGSRPVASPSGTPSAKPGSPRPILLYGAGSEHKIAAAALIGDHFKQDVYRIDLPAIVSKYIGETEKNLEKIFSQAAGKDWILFFDEADALFGKRTEVKDSHDRYQQTEANYLLQKIEQYPNLVLLATNNKSQVPPALLKHFHTTLRFPKKKK
jgi:SpoVK/Ycf46/Vps4 family AAA+-type ATPase